MSKQCLIFAANAAQARQYINSTGRPLRDFVIVTGPEVLRGVDPRDFDYVLLNAWRENHSVVEAYDAWRVRVKTHRAPVRRR